MANCPSHDELRELARDPFGFPRAEFIQAHLDDCEACGSWYDSLVPCDDLEEELQRAVHASFERSFESGQATLGRYHILKRIGSGGMGIVYEAQQARPSRRVALKVLNPACATPSGLRRFQVEAQALSLLDHPSIAHVYEVGSMRSAYGELPFLAMELIAGESPLEHARSKRLTVRPRVELFLKICEGVEHAHGRGVLHRDLKPSNILVQQDGQPKLLDFGLARLIGRSSDSTGTRVGQVLGTLKYMSPEQLAGGADAVDVRSDVFALGRILGELLSQEAAESPSDLKRAKAVLELAAGHANLPKSYLPEVDADLIAILAKSLEKQRDARYPSALAFRADLGRWLAREPIEARPWNWQRRLLSTLRKHRGAVGGLAMIFLLLAGGTVGTFTQLVRAQAAERVAIEEAEAAAATGKFLDELLSSGDPFDSLARPDRSVRELLVEAARQLTLETEFPGPTRESLLGTLGRAFMHQGDFARAREHMELRLELLGARLSDKHPEALDATLDLVLLGHESRHSHSALELLDSLQSRIGPEQSQRALELRGRVSLGLFRAKDALDAFDQALALPHERWVDSGDSSETEARIQLFRARAFGMLGDDERAIVESHDALSRLERALGVDHPLTAQARHQVALLHVRLGSDDAATELFQSAIHSFDKVLGSENIHSPYVASDWGDLLSRSGDKPAATALYRRALAGLPKESGELHVHRRARVCVRLALLLEESGDADDLLAEASTLMGIDSTGNFDTTHPLVRLAKALSREQRYEEVEELYTRVLAGIDPAERDSAATLTLYNNLAVALARQGKLEQAEVTYRRTLETRVDLLGTEHVRTSAAEANLACLLIQKGEFQEALARIEHALAVSVRELGKDHARSIRYRRHYAEALLATGEVERAVLECKQALDLGLASNVNPNSMKTGDTWLLHGECLLASGRLIEARESLVIARSILERQPLPDQALLARASSALAACSM